MVTWRPSFTRAHSSGPTEIPVESKVILPAPLEGTPTTFTLRTGEVKRYTAVVVDDTTLASAVAIQ